MKPEEKKQYELLTKSYSHALDSLNHKEMELRSLRKEKRDMFAAHVVQGISVNAGRNEFSFNDPEQIADMAYQIADAMMVRRKC